MEKDLHKRLEEAAEKYIKIITPDDIPYYHKDVKQGFKAGAKHGYKEAITLAKEWLDEHGKLDKLDLVEFDMGMNKLWEEKK